MVKTWICDNNILSLFKPPSMTLERLSDVLLLQRHYQQLCEELAKLKPPPGLEDLADPEEPTWQQDMEKLVSQVLE